MYSVDLKQVEGGQEGELQQIITLHGAFEQLSKEELDKIEKLIDGCTKNIIKVIKGEEVMIDNEGMVMITRERYENLEESQAKLDALECAGVDNWQGYDYAMEILHEEEEE